VFASAEVQTEIKKKEIEIPKRTLFVQRVACFIEKRFRTL